MRTSQAALSMCGSTNLDGADWEPFAREDLPVHADVWEKMSNTGRSWPRTVIDWQARRLIFLGRAFSFSWRVKRNLLMRRIDHTMALETRRLTLRAFDVQSPKAVLRFLLGMMIRVYSADGN